MSSIVNRKVVARAERLRESFRAAEPFPHVVIDDFLDPEICEKLVAEFPAYDEDEFRNEWNELGKAWHEDVASLGDAYQRLDLGLRSPEFLDLLSKISGIPNLLFDPHYFGGGTHENLHGMELDPHIDFNFHPELQLHRRLNLLLYLNEGWDESWGGSLELHTNPWLGPGEDRIERVAPELNRCVIFETSDRSWHGFRRLDLPEDRRDVSRKSFAMYLYTRERPPLQMIPHDITIYTDRPLPENIRPGHALSQEDVAELECLLTRRDRKLEYLYGRAIDYAQTTLQERLANAVILERSEEREEPARAGWLERGLRSAADYLARTRS